MAPPPIRDAATGRVHTPAAELSPLEDALVSEIRAARAETRDALAAAAKAGALIVVVFFLLLTYQTSLIAQLAGSDPRAAAEATRTVFEAAPR